MRPAAAVVALLAALAVLVWSPGSGSAGSVSHEPRLATPATNVLRGAGGTLWWADRNCRVEYLRLRTGARAGAGGHCHIWPAPSGRVALASLDTSGETRPSGRLELLANGLHSAGEIHVRADTVHPGVSWSPDGSAVAFCTSHGRRPAVVVVNVSAVSGSGEPGAGALAAGRCRPAFLPGGELATSDGRHVFVGATRLPVDHNLMRLAGGGPLDVAVTAMAASPAGLVLAVVRRGPPDRERQTLLVTVRPDGEVVRIDHPPRGLIDAIGVSPDGAWLSVEYAIAGGTRLIPLDAPQRPAAVPAITRGVAWSPDGRLMAVALPGQLRIVDLRSGRSTSITDVDPISVSWTR